MANVKTDSRTDKPLKPRKQKTVVGEVMSAFDHDKHNRSALEKVWDQAHKDYACSRVSRKYPWKSNLFIPAFFSDVETRLPTYLMSMLSEVPIASCLPFPNAEVLRGQDEQVGIDGQGAPVMETAFQRAISKSKMCDALLARQMHPTKIVYQLTKFLKSVCMYNKAVLKVLWDTKTQSPRIINVDIWDWFPDMAAGNLEESSHCIYRAYRYLKQIKKERGYFNLDKLKKVSGTKEGTTSKSERLSNRGLSEPRQGAQKENPQLEFLEWWGDDYMAAVERSTQTLVRWYPREKHPYKGSAKGAKDVPDWLVKPFIDFSPYPMQSEQYGMSDFEATESLQAEINDLRNQRLDNVHIIGNPMWMAGPRANVAQSQLVSKPGKVVHVGAMDDFGLLPMPEPRPEMFQEEQTAKSDLQWATGTFDYMRGATPPRAEAVGVFKGLQAAASRRFQAMVLRLGAEVIKPVAKMFIEMDRRLLRSDYVLRMTGDNKAMQDFKILQNPAEDLPTEIDIMPVLAGEQGSKQARIQQLNNFLAIMGQAMPPAAIMKLAESIGRELIPTEIDGIMATMRREQARAEAMQAAQQATGGGGGRGSPQRQPGAGATEAGMAQSEGALGQGGGTQ